MAGGKFNQTLPLNPKNFYIEWPEGPLVWAAGETILRVEVWVMQKSTGGIQMTFQNSNFGLNNWKADQIWWPGTNATTWLTKGLFRPGPAMGSAVVISKDTFGDQSYYAWSEEVDIV